MKTPRESEAGVVLINVLVVTALAASVVYLMLKSQEVSLARAQGYASASAADALARGGETSAIVALRRDASEAPDSDHYGEAWAQISQDEVELATGRFAVSISDAQSRLNLNDLAGGGLQTVQLFLKLLKELDLPVALGAQVAAELRQAGPVSSLDALAALDSDTRDILSPYVDALPERSPVNLNTAPPLVLQILFNNPSAARRIASIRDSAGFVTPEDLARVGVIKPPGSDFKSSLFDVTALAEVDGTEVFLSSRLQRRRARGGGTDVVVIARRYGTPEQSAANPE